MNYDYNKEFEQWYEKCQAIDHRMFHLVNKNHLRSGFIAGFIRAMDIQNEKTNLAGEQEPGEGK